MSQPYGAPNVQNPGFPPGNPVAPNAGGTPTWAPGGPYPQQPPYAAPYAQPYPQGPGAFPTAPPVDTKAQYARARAVGWRVVAIGVALLAVGIVLTYVGRKFAEDHGGGTYIVFSGLMVVGVVRIIRGLIIVARPATALRPRKRRR